MQTVARTTNPNGTYRYSVEGQVVMAASKTLYTFASEYTVGDLARPVLFHKTEAAALRATGHAKLGWSKLGVSEIQAV